MTESSQIRLKSRLPANQLDGQREALLLFIEDARSEAFLLEYTTYPNDLIRRVSLKSFQSVSDHC
jgi:hypothetical protein